ncbi:LIC11966 family surface protein [Paucihalobacter sp.]|uniref:LIC11966 family surface protein n=1 Tax=Paucihalobacter sp. TaxID=2850405 RepID=UPI002FE3952C
MKKNYTLLLLLLTLSLTTQSQNFENASQYLDFVSEEQENITKNMWKYTKALAHSKSDRAIESKRSTLVKSVEKAIAKIEKAEGFDGDEYKNQVLTYMRLNESLLKQDYAKIIDLKEVAEQSYDYMEAYILAQELADKKMEEAYEEFDTHFRVFAANHNINIIESESDLGNKMKISSEVFKHYNALHLLHFKASINEAYLMDALERNDMSAIQQNANALSESAKEGLEILKTQDLYKNDRSIIDATQRAFEFYIKEANEEMPKLIEFLALNEAFETIKETLEKTPEKKRTKAQVDSYNKKVNEINKAVKTYNKTNADLNNNRQRIITKLNIVNENFLAKHIPND